MKILYVEDGEIELELGSRLLRLLGNDVTSASSLIEARKYSQEKFDVLLTGGLDGDWKFVCEEIRASRKIVLNGNRDFVNEAREKGYEGHSKPVSLLKILGKQR